MSDLLKKILELNAETGWTAEDVEQPEAGQAVFQRYTEELLALLHEHHPKIWQACISVAGLECGYFQPVATWPNEIRTKASRIPRDLADVLHGLSGENLVLAEKPELHPLLRKENMIVGGHLVIKLIGYNEYYGLIWLDAEEDYFTGERLTEITEIVPALSRTVSEAIFSMRLQRLAAPLKFDHRQPPTREEIYNHIARQAALGLAADGAVLRIYDQQSRQLVMKGLHGLVNEDWESHNDVRERICHRVFEAPVDEFGTARSITSGQFFGVEITPQDELELQALGIESYMIMRLQSEVDTNGGPERIGTLAIFHNRPHNFSLRDIRLFLSFSERIGDDLALLEQKGALEELIQSLKVQFSMITRAEIISLLAHDLGHKALGVTESARRFTDSCRKALRDKRSPDAVDDLAEEVAAACNRMENEIAQIRAVSKNADEPSVIFDMKELLVEIGSTLRNVLDRNNMQVELSTSGNMNCYGPRSILSQALFNLFINSIDAQKSLERSRKNVVHIHCRGETQGERRRIIIQFWDDGPGISHHHFPILNRIFEIGATSKPEGQGTGTGLPISRSLLTRFFRADMDIKERRPARFEILVPVQIPKETKEQ